MESYEPSQTVDKITDLIGRGKMSVAAACELAVGIVLDHKVPHGAVKAFSTLGGNGLHPQNSERDLHRWLKALYGFKLEPYVIELNLQVDNQKVQKVPVRVLLPHEILHAVATMESKLFFDSVFLGNMDSSAREQFWRYIRTLGPWSTHKILQRRDCDLKRLIGITIHGDGAVMKRDDECFCWSISSCFGQEGLIKDPLHLKYPVAIIPERHMLTKEVPRLILFSSRVLTD